MDDETAKLHARIAAYESALERRKRGESNPQRAHHASSYPYPPRGNSRWATRGARGGRTAYHSSRPSQNWVWKNDGTPTPPSAEPTALPSADAPGTPPAASTARNGFIMPPISVGKKELMTKETYEREQKQKQDYMQQRAIQPQLQATSPTPKAAQPSKHKQSLRRITVEGITFQVSSDGSKLVRESGGGSNDADECRPGLKMLDLADMLQQTPKKTIIAGVEFHRTKRGNLLRAPAKADNTRFNNAVPKAQCETFTRQGSCPFGPKCRFAHDPTKVAICKGLLLNGSCPAGDYCDLSHEMSYHRVSACTHFLRGNCTNDACRYPHVNISPSAPVCRAFASLGYCASGEQCPRRHVPECPDHANRGKCTNSKCQLPHVDRASVLRKAAEREKKTIISSEDDSDLSSDDGSGSDHESELDEVEEDDKDAVMTALGDKHELSQQQDFVAFS